MRTWSALNRHRKWSLTSTRQWSVLSKSFAAVLDGLPNAVSLLSLSLVAASLIFLLALPESRGLELESADAEHPPASPGS